ncbi:MAG: arsenic resistance N-acetyltransferase ArsN2 [Gemmatimonadota bacterium]|nr:arsenic resistance N-acetyltransferase ArsN2 [Gemmatimonadota bacterium]
MTRAPRIRAATAADLPSVLALLRAVDLPVDGIGAPLTGFVVADRDGQVVGVAGLEAYGPAGLLRSVAVRPDGRGGGTGRRLVERVLVDARASGMRDVYLLTTTAADYFPRLGFRPIPRSAVPPAVQGSVEFREACPASAVAMHRAVRDLPVPGR